VTLENATNGNHKAKIPIAMQLGELDSEGERSLRHSDKHAAPPFGMEPYQQITALFGASEDTLHVMAGRPRCYQRAARTRLIYHSAPLGNRPSGLKVVSFPLRRGDHREQACRDRPLSSRRSGWHPRHRPERGRPRDPAPGIAGAAPALAGGCV
jgi:hypothetical protein